MARLYNKNNFLCLYRGPTGAGKTWSALKLCEYADPTFDSSRIIFSVKDFLNKWKSVPEKGFLLWDEPGLFLGQRNYNTVENKIAMEVIQSFRYRRVNVVFATPSEFYVDKVVRELLHRIVDLPERLSKEPPVSATVLRPVMFQGFRIWIPEGEVAFYPPSKSLIDDYEALRKNRIEDYYERLGKRLEHHELREQRQLQPEVIKRSIDEMAEEAKSYLNDILSPDWERKIASGETRNIVNSVELKKRLGVSQGKTYEVRDELIRHLRSQEYQTAPVSETAS